MESHDASIEVHAQLRFCVAHRSAQQVVCCAPGMALAHLSQDSVPLTRFQGVQADFPTTRDLRSRSES